MSFSEFLKNKTAVALVAIPSFIIIGVYVLSLAGALLDGMGNDDYRAPLIIQAGVWCAVLGVMISYNNFAQKNNQEPSPDAMKILYIIFYAVSFVGIILGELYSGLYFGQWGMFS